VTERKDDRLQKIGDTGSEKSFIPFQEEPLYSNSSLKPFAMTPMDVAGMLTEMSTRITKEAMKNADQTVQYFLRLLFLQEAAVENKNMMQSPTPYVSAISVGINEKGKTSKPERVGRLTPHIRRSVNKPR
jgi:hypothetical protein